jgi:hypothetical protein
LSSANRGWVGTLAAARSQEERDDAGSVVNGSVVKGSVVNGSVVKGSVVKGSVVNGSVVHELA